MVELKPSKNNKKCLFKTIIMMILISLLKILILYGYTNQKHIITAFLRTIPWVLLFYSLLIFVKPKWLRLSSFIIHAIVGGILFADLVYHQYYGFLPSITMLLIADNVPTVWKSIFFVLRPIYFIMLIDLIPLGILLRKRHINYSLFNIKLKNVIKVTGPIMAVILFLPGIYIDGNSTYAYNNYGIFTYHVYDAYTQLANKDEIIVSGEDLEEKVEEIADSIDEPTRSDKNYRGIAKGKNIILVQFESLQNFVINDVYNGQELTPNLNKFIKKDSIYFKNYYQQVGPGNTSDTEFVIQNSMYPTNDVSIFKNYSENNFYTLPMILKEKGYSTYSFHGNDKEFWGRNEIYPRFGIDNFISLEDFNYDEEEDLINLGLNDMDFFDQSVDHLKEAKNPFYSILISITSHHPYDMPQELIDIELKEEHEGTIFGNYIQSINYADKAFGDFIEKLKREGLYEDSLIVVYGDHAGLYPARAKNKEILSDYLGREYNFDEFMNVPLIFHLPGKNITGTRDIVGGAVDILPTMLNLLDIVDNKGKRYGEDLLNSSKGFVANQYYVPIGSFIDDEKVFEMSPDGIFENSRAWNRVTKEPIDIEDCREGYERALRELEESKLILENDLIDDIIRQQTRNQDK